MNHDNAHRQVLFFIRLATAALITAAAINALCTQDVTDKKQKHTDTTKTTKLNNIDNLNQAISVAWQNISDVRNGVKHQVQDSLARNPEYAFVVENAPRIDSLRAVNEQLLARAYKAAKRNAIHSVPYSGERVFTYNANIPDVKNIKHKYMRNKNEIKLYQKRRDATCNIPNMVQAHFDTRANNLIAGYLNEIDSLLKIKDSLITQKTR